MSISLHKLGRIRDIPLSLSEISSLTETILKKEKIQMSGDLMYIFCDKPNIRRLNRLCFNTSAETDVIAIPFHKTSREFRKLPAGADNVFGDVYICLPKAKDNAATYNESYKREVTRLIIHGLLHLLGYDDLNPTEKRKMWTKQETYVHDYYN